MCTHNAEVDMKPGFGRISLLCLLVLWVWGAGLAQTLPRDVRERIIAATVFITYPVGNNSVSTGSGTLISPQGFILTNYHVIGDLENRRIVPRIFVGVVRFVDQPPEVRFLADVVAADPNLDLALLRITRTSGGQPIGNMTFPAVPIGDSNKLIVGDPIYVFGFQGTGGNTITFSSGAVGGFTGEDMESGGKQWIKHDAQTGPGNSGGGIYNQDGELIGIHTRGVSGQGNSRTAFMRPSALAWGLVGPNVAGLVNRAPAASTPQPQPAATTAWPPAIHTGQTWQVRVQGGQWTGEWSVVVGQKDADGDFVATASLGSRRTEALFFQQDNIVRLNIGDSYPLARCRFDPQNASGAIQGKLFVFKDANADAEEVGTCVASQRGAQAVQPQQPQAAAWPPRLAVGQRWQLAVTGPDLEDAGTITLSERDSDGDPKGTVLFKENFSMVAYFYLSRSGAAFLDMTVPSGADSHRAWWRCRFEQQNTATLKGTLQTFKTDSSGQISDLKEVGACTATLNR
jgi:serine protease Do